LFAPARACASQRRSTTPDLIDGAQFFEVTHPFHPLRGRKFALVDRRLTWGEDRVYYFDEANTLRRLPVAWTSIAARSAFELMAAGRSHFRVEDLLRLVALIARQKEGKRAATRRRKVSSK
jgi:hypothetical protein